MPQTEVKLDMEKGEQPPNEKERCKKVVKEFLQSEEAKEQIKLILISIIDDYLRIRANSALDKKSPEEYEK